jgi:exopolysaccharide production protein ExoZ
VSGGFNAYAGAQPEGQWAVEAWRGVAALLVLSTHWAPLAGGHNLLTAFAFTGVDVFFVISGYVFAPHVLGRANMALAPYALRRLLRIYPAYLVALALYAVWKFHTGAPLLYLGEHLLMLHVQSREMAFYYSPPFWSLPSEVAFYAAVPLLAWMSRGRHAAWAWVGLVVLAAVARVAFAAMADVQGENLAYLLVHHLPGLLIEFLMGTWAWRQVQRRAEPGVAVERSGWRWWAAGLLLYGAATAGYWALEHLRGSQWLHGQLSLLAAAAFALVLVGTAQAQPTGAAPRALGWWAGRLSYGVYLLHPLWGLALAAWVPRWGPAAGLGLAALGLAASALALHLAVEEPMRRWGRRWAQQWARP